MRLCQKVWVSHPTGNTFVRALLSHLEEQDADYEFFTTLGFRLQSLGHLPLPQRWHKALERRAYPCGPGRLKTQPLREAIRLALEKSGTRLPSTSALSAYGVYKALDDLVADKLRKSVTPPALVHAYEDGALMTFRIARERGVLRSYELPIAYWETSRKLLFEEAQRLPAWAPTLGIISEPEEKYERKTEEIQLAERIFCPSEFVLNSIPATVRRRTRCVVAPFGSPTSAHGPQRRQRSGSRLRVLFAGTLTQRKGLADLFSALRLLRTKQIETIVLGSLAAPLSFYKTEFPDFVYESPRPHSDVLRLMESCDVLVLPSIVEGRALVQQEALACGLPLIVTPNAGGEDLVSEGDAGFLVPIRSPAGIAEKLNWFLDHPAELEQMRHAAPRRAERLTWAGYAEALMANWSHVAQEKLSLANATGNHG